MKSHPIQIKRNKLTMLWRRGRRAGPLLLRPVGKLVMLSESSWSSIPIKCYESNYNVLVRKICLPKKLSEKYQLSLSEKYCRCPPPPP